MKNIFTNTRINKIILTLIMLISFNSCIMIIYSNGGVNLNGKGYNITSNTNPKNFKKYINYSGTFTPDGKQFYFTSNRINNYIEKISDKTNIFNTSQDIWYVNVISNENDSTLKFDLPKNLNEIMEINDLAPIDKINTQLNEGYPCFSNDGRFMYFSACNRPTGLGYCDIFVSEKINNKWTTPYNLDSNINSRNMESSPFISNDGKKLLFVSSRKYRNLSDGQDILQNNNIWESNYNEITKSWSKAQIINNINSQFAEMSPTMNENGDTIYFSTTRFSKDSTFDIAYSVFEKINNQWSAPQKFDNSINSIYNSDTDDLMYFKSPYSNYIILNTRRNDINNLSGVVFNSSETWLSNQELEEKDDMKIIIIDLNKK